MTKIRWKNIQIIHRKNPNRAFYWNRDFILKKTQESSAVMFDFVFGYKYGFVFGSFKRLAYTLTAYCYGSKSVTQPEASSKRYLAMGQNIGLDKS